jgi:glycosyltransferase involved in cell wall biosynthesis
MLKIGFDAKRLFNNTTGLGNYSRTLVSKLKEYYPLNDYLLYTPKIVHTSQTDQFLQGGYTVRKPESMPGWLWRSAYVANLITKDKIDVFHGLSHELPMGIHRTSTCSVVTIHDIIYKFHPGDFPWFDRKVYDFKFRYACEKSDRIIAISESTKTDIMLHYGVPEDKISVIYQTCNDAFKQSIDERTIDTVLQQYHLPKEYLLYVGTINQRKNLLSIVQAVHQLGNKLTIPLLVVGNGKEYKQTVMEYIKKHHLESKILFAPYIQNTDLPAVYTRASIFIFPSRYEGFGIPVIEALYCKTPVITSRMSSLPEAAGPGAYYIDVDEPATIAEGIDKILSVPTYATQLTTQGYNYVQQFNNENATRRLMGIYERISKAK